MADIAQPGRMKNIISSVGDNYNKIANSSFISGVYLTKYGRVANEEEQAKFAGKTVADVGNLVFGAQDSPFSPQYNKGTSSPTSPTAPAVDSSVARQQEITTKTGEEARAAADAQKKAEDMSQFEMDWAKDIPGMPQLPSEPYPQAPDLVEEWKALRLANGMEGTETALNDKIDELTAFEDSYEEGRYDVGQKLTPMALVRGEQAELQEQYIRQKNSKTRVIDSLQRSLDGKRATVEIMMDLTQKNFDNVRASYNDQFDNAMKFQEQFYQQFSDQRDYSRLVSNDAKDRDFQERELQNRLETQVRNEARANLTALMDSFVESGKAWADLSPTDRNSIRQLEMSAGLPAGSTQAFSRSKPEAKLLGQVSGVDSAGNDIVTFMYANPDGTPGMMVTKKTGGFTSQGGGGGAPSSTQSDRDTNATRTYLQNTVGAALSGSALDTAVRYDNENSGFATWFAGQINASPASGWSVGDINDAFNKSPFVGSPSAETIQQIRDEFGVGEEEAIWLWKEEKKTGFE